MGNRWATDAWKDNKEDKMSLAYFLVDHNYMDMLKLKLIAGNNFPENLSDENEQFMKFQMPA